MDMHAVVDGCLEDIAEQGYVVAAVTADTTGCDWAYTVGLSHSFDHPELVIVGIEAPLAGAVLESLAEQVASGVRLDGGGTHGRVGPVQLRFDPVDPVFCSHSDWFNLGREVMNRWGRSWPHTLQVVWADQDGRFPERSDDPSWFLRQPLFTGS